MKLWYIQEWWEHHVFQKNIPKIHLPAISTNPILFSKPSKHHQNKNPQTHRKRGEYKVPIEAEWYVPGCGPRRGAQKVTTLGRFFIPRDRGTSPKGPPISGDLGGHSGVASGVQKLATRSFGEKSWNVWDSSWGFWSVRFLKKKHNSFLQLVRVAQSKTFQKKNNNHR